MIGGIVIMVGKFNWAVIWGEWWKYERTMFGWECRGNVVLEGDVGSSEKEKCFVVWYEVVSLGRFWG